MALPLPRGLGNATKFCEHLCCVERRGSSPLVWCHCHFPGRRYEGLYGSISPVNSFRVVLNTVFGAQLPLLPDRSFYSTWPELYRFIDVTGIVRGDAASQAAAPARGIPFDPHDS